jgi:hypothetical protein
MKVMNQKRTLDELCAMYVLEPELRDIFVEGCSDERFVKWYLRANGATAASVYSIDLIDIPDAILRQHDLSIGSNRSQLIALANELLRRCPGQLNVLCLADRDYEDYQPSGSTSRYLLFTDYNSMELYAFSPAAMDKFVAVALGGLPLGCNDLIAVLTHILGRVFAVRLSNQLLGWAMEWVPFVKYVEIRKGAISFKADEFVRVYLQKNGRWRDRAAFDAEVSEVIAHFTSDARRRIRGHDFSELLLHIIRKLRRDRKYGDSETLEGALRASLECANLSLEPCFQRILELAASA